ncbi:MAG: porphobilinogen synthase [Ignavibacteria bacterium]|nr:porphobilinogen synthase [Ignavibacteria bacterium]
MTPYSEFPAARLRRLRMNPAFRAMVSETRLAAADLIYPLFVVPGKGIRNEVSSMPGVFQLSVDELVIEAEEVRGLGIPAVILFGIPEKKDEVGSEAYNENGIIQTALQTLKKQVPELVLITDVCLCEYTSHGHCGIVRDGEILNDESVDLLVREALSHARAGADMVAPSDMFDGRVGAIRRSLDDAGFLHTPIISYAAKYSSAFYGPFREAAESTPAFGDRRSHQMNPANRAEAMREVEQDLQEGADIVMVKPALPYLDVIAEVKSRFGVPTAAYNVSGEYAMIKAASRNGWIDGEKVMMETLISIRRAGADLILTYFAKEAASLLRERG